MKIIHLATSLSAGAGSAALRLNTALNSIGQDSIIISRSGISSEQRSNVNINKIKKLKTLESSLVTYLQAKILQKNMDLVTPVSIDAANYKFKILEQADIIHIHSYYNYLNSDSLRRIINLRKPIFFTIHDQRLFTGGCHYSRSCKDFQLICNKCPQVKKPFVKLVEKSFLKQKNLFNGASNVELISPSNWLAKLAQVSDISRNLPVHVIKNPIPEIFFETQVPYKNSLEHSLRIAFVAANLQNPYKDLLIFSEAINQCAKVSLRQISVILVGRGSIPVFNSLVQVENVNPQNDFEMVSILRTVDLLVVPSNQDNSPSVIGEALALGIHVIGSDIGGIPEALSKYNMPVFPVGSVQSLVNLILKFKPQFRPEFIRQIAKQEYSETCIAKKVIGLYNDLQGRLI